MIYISIIVFVVSFIITFLLVPINMRVSEKMGNIDYPRERSIHKNPTPKSGGMSLVIAIIAILLVLLSFNFIARDSLLLPYLIGGILITILGLLDDLHDYSAWKKVLIESAIVLIVYHYGYKIDLITNPFGEPINVGILSYPLTLLWFLFIINSINLIDGLDGLAVGISIIVIGVLGFFGLMSGNTLLAYCSFCLVGSCLAFLKYNFYPAKIFLGDAGSLFLGFSIAALSVAGNHQFKGPTAMTLIVPIFILSIPIIDTIHAIFRRLKSSKNIFQADKNHIHHKMLNIGFSYKTVVLISYFLTILFSLIAIGFTFIDQKVLFSLLVVIGLIIFLIFYKIIKKEFLK